MDAALVDDFKLAMRRLAATVAIITSCRDDDETGMAATAVSAVSADPPSLVIGVNQQASLHEMIEQSGAFCVNLLSAPHNDLIQPFSGKSKGRERFAFGEWDRDAAGVPFLKDAMASLVCAVDARMTYGSHTLFVGKVQSIRIAQAAEPLIWQDGRSATVSPLQLISGGTTTPPLR